MSEEKKYIEQALWRHYGDMEPEAKETLQQFCEAQDDWWALCQKCGKRREGTIAQLKEPCSCAETR